MAGNKGREAIFKAQIDAHHRIQDRLIRFLRLILAFAAIILSAATIILSQNIQFSLDIFTPSYHRSDTYLTNFFLNISLALQHVFILFGFAFGFSGLTAAVYVALKGLSEPSFEALTQNGGELDLQTSIVVTGKSLEILRKRESECYRSLATASGSVLGVAFIIISLKLKLLAGLFMVEVATLTFFGWGLYARQYPKGKRELIFFGGSVILMILFLAFRYIIFHLP